MLIHGITADMRSRCVTLHITMDFCLPFSDSCFSCVSTIKSWEKTQSHIPMKQALIIFRQRSKRIRLDYKTKSEIFYLLKCVELAQDQFKMINMRGPLCLSVTAGWRHWNSCFLYVQPAIDWELSCSQRRLVYWCLSLFFYISICFFSILCFDCLSKCIYSRSYYLWYKYYG